MPSEPSLSNSYMRHPLACKKFTMEFEGGVDFTPTPLSGGCGSAPAGQQKRLEPFELFRRYTAIRPIAKGTYGYVIAARDDDLIEAWNALPDEDRVPQEGISEESFYDQKTLVAIKKVPHIFEYGVSRAWLCAAREAQMLLHFQHENVINATDFFIPLGSEHLVNADTIKHQSEIFEDVYIVMPYKDMSLREVFRRNALKIEGGAKAGTHRRCETTGEVLCPLGGDYRQFILYQLLRGVGYLHACRVTHRDLKPENVLVDLDYRCMICDFGQARDLSAPDDVVVEPLSPSATQSGAVPTISADAVSTMFDNCTQWYAAPETLTLIDESTGSQGILEEEVLHSADVWAVGAIAAEMLLGRPLFFTRHGGGFSQLHAIVETRGPLTPEDLTALTRDRHPEAKSLYVEAIDSTVKHSKSSVKNQSDFQQLLRSSCPLADATDSELDLIEQLLHYDPRKRPTAEQAIHHPFFVDAGYEPIVDPDKTARPLNNIVQKSDIETAAAARQCFWGMFLEKHNDVQQLIDVLEAQSGLPGSQPPSRLRSDRT